MAHLRHRSFNTKDTYPEQNLDNDLCQAVVAGDTIYLRGQVAQDLDTRESLAIGDPEGQAEKAMANVAMLLEECGSCLEDICVGHEFDDGAAAAATVDGGGRSLRHSPFVRLTPKGKTLAEEIVDALVQTNKALIGGILEPEETEQLATLLRKLSLGLEARKSSNEN